MAETLVRSTKKALTFEGLLEEMKPRLAKILPQHLTAERMLALASLAAVKTPGLKTCSPLSIVNALVQSSKLGLEIGTQVHLVPFGGECVAIPDYRGLISLATRSGLVRHIDARVVYKGDKFRYVLGSAPVIEHEPSMDTDRSDDNILAFYAVAHLASGMAVFDEPMSKKQIDAVRERSRAKSNGPWVTDYQAMGKKTVVKRLAKFLPQTPEVAAAVELDNRAETGEVSTVSDVIDTKDSVNDAVAQTTQAKLDDLRDEMSGSAGEATPPTGATQELRDSEAPSAKGQPEGETGKTRGRPSPAPAPVRPSKSEDDDEPPV